MKGVVTVKLRKNPKHDPRNKRSGKCPLSRSLGYVQWCTDTTGSHHSYIESGFNGKEIQEKAEAKFNHITRIEYFDD